MAKSDPAGLVRSFGTADLISATINVVIGAGIYGLPGKVFALVGDFSVVSVLVCAVFVFLIIICFAEVASRFRDTGGPYLYAREAFGTVIGFEAGWLLWLARVTAFAANSNLLVSYAAYFWPRIGDGMGRNLFLCGVILALVIINIRGVQHAARVNNLFTAGKLIPITLFIGVGLWFADWGRFTFAGIPGFPPFSNSVLLLVYAFTGFEMTVITAGEMRDPERNVPSALLAAIAIVTAIYLLIQLVCIGTLPELAASQRPLADAASRFLGRFGAAIISAGIVVSIAGNLHISILTGSRIPFAMAQQGQMPRFLAATHARFRTPYLAILFSGAVVLVLALSGTFVYAATVSTLTRLMIYVTTCAALPALRRQAGAPRAAFLVPGGTAIAIAAILLAVWLISNSTWREARDTGIAAALGFVVFGLSKARRSTALL